jgi:hypothetical protein
VVATAPAQEGRTTRLLLWIAIADVLVMIAVYLSLILAQDNRPPDLYTVPFVAGYLLLTATLLGASLSARPAVVQLRPALRAGGAAGLLVLGVLAAFSIGLPILLAGFLATGAAIRTLAVQRTRVAVFFEVAAAVVALVILIGGFEVTERIIVCPAHGIEAGTFSGFITGGFSYDCNEGRLTIR